MSTVHIKHHDLATFWRDINRNNDEYFCTRKGDPGERLSVVAKEKNILLMVCDQCAVRRDLAEGTL